MEKIEILLQSVKIVLGLIVVVLVVIGYLRIVSLLEAICFAL